MDIKIAGVLCCYNSEAFIVKTLDSIFGQTRPLDALVIIDDCSKDNTVQELKNYLARLGDAARNVTLLQNTHNLGASMSFNSGLMFCKERYAMLLSHDDINHPERVARTAEAFAGGAAIVCSYMDIPANGQKVMVPEDPHRLALMMGLSNVITAPTVAMDLEITKKHKLYFNPQNDYAEDYDLWCQYILNGLDFTVIHEYLIAYTLHEQQTSVLKQKAQIATAEKIRKNYLHNLFPFIPTEQAEILITALIHQPQILPQISKDFINLVITETGKLETTAKNKNLYKKIKAMLVSI